MNLLNLLLDAAAEAWWSHATAMLWQAALVVVVVAVADRALARRVRAVTRHALWLLVLAKLILPPSLSLPTSPAYWWTPRTAESAGFSVHYPSPSEPSGAAIQGAPGTTGTLAMAADEGGSAVVRALFVLWLAGAAGGGTWIAVRTLHLHRTLRRLARNGASSPAAAQDLPGIARALGLRRIPRLVETDALPAPSVAGLWRPTLILPTATVSPLSPAQWRSVLWHELAHVRRGDLWVNALQVALQVLYWWHPAVWYAMAQLRRVREEATDETVVARSREDAGDYAQTLVTVARTLVQRRTLALGFLGILESRRALQARVERILDCDPAALGDARLGRAGWRTCVALAVVLLPLASRPWVNPAEAQGAPTALIAPPDPRAPEVRAPEDVAPRAGDPTLPEPLASVRVSTLGLQDVSLPDAVIQLNRALERAGAAAVIRLKDPAFARPANGRADFSAEITRAARDRVFETRVHVPAGAGTLRLAELLDILTRSASKTLAHAYQPDGSVVLSLPDQLQTRTFRVQPGMFEGTLARAIFAGRPPEKLEQKVAWIVENTARVSRLPPNRWFFNPEGNLLMVRATEPELERLERVLGDLTHQDPQVQMEAKIMEVDDAAAKGVALPELARQQAPGSKAGVLTEPQSELILRALEQRHGSRLIAMPRVLTLSEREAVLEMSSPEARENEPRAPGVRVWFLPKVTPDGVTLDVSARAELIHLVDLRQTTQAASAAPAQGAVMSVNAQGYVVTKTDGHARLFDGQTLVLELPKPNLGAVVDGADPHAGRRIFAFLNVRLIDPVGNAVHGPGPNHAWPPRDVPPQTP